MHFCDPKYEEEITESQDIIEVINDDRVILRHSTKHGDGNTDSCAQDQLAGYIIRQTE